MKKTDDKYLTSEKKERRGIKSGDTAVVAKGDTGGELVKRQSKRFKDYETGSDGGKTQHSKKNV